MAVCALEGGGLTVGAFMNVFRHSAVTGAIAIGMGLVCLTGEIDLSVGSMLTFVANFAVVARRAAGPGVVHGASWVPPARRIREIRVMWGLRAERAGCKP